MKVMSIGGFKEWAALTNSSKPHKLFEALSEKEQDRLQEQFAKWLLQLLKAQAQECIRSQRFPAQFAPLSPSWAKRKKEQGLKPGFWIATGTLVKTMSVWKDKETKKWVLGWKPDVVSPLNGQPVAAIAAGLERGDKEGHRPARPLFTILSAKLSRNIYRVFYVFCEREHPEHLKLLPKP